MYADPPGANGCIAVFLPPLAASLRRDRE